jgi:hypothetical protein
MASNMHNHQRKLLILPILHAKEDMGSLGNQLSIADGYTTMASEFWQEVTQRVKQYINGFIKVKIYQDGLPDTQKGLVEKILNEVQSPNYELLRFLKEKGAKVFGTEDQELLKKEYQFITLILREQDEIKKNKLKQAYQNQANELLTKRDAYIANRIDKTLTSGELGILFIGAAHAVEEKLPVDIQVETL